MVKNLSESIQSKNISRLSATLSTYFLVDKRCNTVLNNARRYKNLDN